MPFCILIHTLALLWRLRATLSPTLRTRSASRKGPRTKADWCISLSRCRFIVWYIARHNYLPCCSCPLSVFMNPTRTQELQTHVTHMGSLRASPPVPATDDTKTHEVQARFTCSVFTASPLRHSGTGTGPGMTRVNELDHIRKRPEPWSTKQTPFPAHAPHVRHCILVDRDCFDGFRCRFRHPRGCGFIKR